MTTRVDLFWCPRHGLLSEREADDCLLEGHDGTMFGSTPDGDPYTGEFFCDLSARAFGDSERCGEKVELVPVAFDLPVRAASQGTENGEDR